MNLGATPLTLPGCYSATLSAFEDARGSFRKLFHAQSFQTLLPGFVPAEVYLTTSAKGVLRGMHFQVPPHDHAKVVICLSGRVTDVLLDLRRGHGFGASTHVELTPQGPNTVLIPKGVAHGFYSHEDGSALLYLVETEHALESDAGVLWNSFGFDWPSQNAILSDRDTKHPTLKSFQSPAGWGGNPPESKGLHK